MFSPNHPTFTQQRVLEYHDGDWHVPGGDAQQVRSDGFSFSGLSTQGQGYSAPALTGMYGAVGVGGMGGEQQPAGDYVGQIADQFSRPSSAAEQFRSPFAAEQFRPPAADQFSRPPSAAEQFSRPSSAAEQFRPPSAAAEQSTGILEVKNSQEGWCILKLKCSIKILFFIQTWS